MVTGDVTTYGPFSQANIADIKTQLEAASVVVADSLTTTPQVNGVWYIVRVEA
jgi:hypothetical protein